MYNLAHKFDINTEKPVVVCLHSSGSSHRQWAQLESDWNSATVIAPDLLGYSAGNSATASDYSVQLEVSRIGQLLKEAPAPVHLIGHSYGGAVATLAAIKYPEDVASLSVFEPVLFSLLFYCGGKSAKEAWSLGADVRRLVMSGDNTGAAQRFISYWNTPSAFARMNERQQRAIANRMPKIAAEFAGLFLETVTVEDLMQLRIPTLVMYGLDSPATTREVAHLLADTLPRVSLKPVCALGHMGPVNQPARVNAMIANFIADVRSNSAIGSMATVQAAYRSISPFAQ